ncbi:MAG TPA: MBL fold metallo-hydrolase [Methanobacterium sp.]|nr:MBL fold metallo-hydrolase [Methanobacterium sp.]
MKTWTTKNCIIYQVLKGRSNSFLINSQNKFILIDAGRKSSWKELTCKLDEILGKNKLSCLILTHAHFDHVENAAKIKEKYKTKIIIHQNESEYLRHGNSPLPKGTNLATGFMTNMFGKRIQSRYNYETVNPDIIVDEKYDLIDFGFNVYIIHTPGHSKGSISIIIDDEFAIAGDAMFGVFGNSVYPPFADDPETMVKSWNKLLKTNSNLFLPGHGKEISRKLLKSQYEKYK